MVDCQKVYVSKSLFSSKNNEFLGVFAKTDIKKDELIEKGIVRLLSDGENSFFDGMNNPYVFTWSNDIPNYKWAIGSGCSTFYNTALEKDANTRMVRYFKENKFEIFAKKDIKKDEELTHTYKSLLWRSSFIDLYKNLLK